MIEYIEDKIPGLYLMTPKVFTDSRGHFLELYKDSNYPIPSSFVQDNMSYSVKGTLRGLHYQLNPEAQGKLVSVLSGQVYDVCVDLRVGSPTYLQYSGFELNSDQYQQLYIPVGCAHGFYVLSDTAILQYKCTNRYSSNYERSIHWSDNTLNIKWPLDGQPHCSDKDKEAPFLDQSESNFKFLEE